MARIRTFIAVDIDEAVRQRAVALQEKLGHISPGVKWVEPESMHITLHFLGEVKELEVVTISRIVRDQVKRIPPFTIEFGGLSAFPTPRRPKILWVGLTEGADELNELHDRLEAPLVERGGYRREDRGYSPHLTLGRLSQEDRAEDWSPIFSAHADWQGGTTKVTEVLVMRSELQRDGPVYTIMGRGKLAGIPVEVEDEE